MLDSLLGNSPFCKLTRLPPFVYVYPDSIDVRRNVRDALKEVIDPEVGISIVEFGLVKEICIENGDVEIRMVLTTPACPLAGYLVEQIRRRLRRIAEVKRVEVTLLDGPWS